MGTDHLALAKECLAIAESGDAKRTAYRQAAEHIAAAKTADPELTNARVALYVGCAANYVGLLLTWRSTGYQAATPWLMDTKATGRAELSHTRKVLREAAPEQIAELVSAALNRDDVIEYLASDVEKAAQVVWRPGNEVQRRSTASHGHGGHQIGGSTDRVPQITRALAQMQILSYLLKATELAVEHNLEKFLLDHLEDARDKAEMSRAAGNPKQAVIELEAWLHTQTKEAS